MLYLFFTLKPEPAPSETVPLNEIKAVEEPKPKELESPEATQETSVARKSSKKSVVPSNDI